jgi:predicted transcriptional regulator with HTH domain
MALNHSQRRAIAFLASENAGSLINMPYVGPKTIAALIKLGLIEVAPQMSHGEPYYRLTEAGNNMREVLSRLMLIPRGRIDPS